jgi:hypothetical protein
LVVKTDNLREEVILNKVLEKTAKDRLLHILHTGRFHSNHSRGLQCLRNESNLNRPLSSRFEEVHFIQHGVKTPIWKKVLASGKNRFETTGPDTLLELLVSKKSISG